MSSLHALRAAFVALGIASFMAGCDEGSGNASGGTPLFPSEGLPRYQRVAAIEVPGGLVNVAGGNLLIRRVDLSIDTLLGTREIGATFNSAGRSWLWTFDIRYDGVYFVDPSGAEHVINSLDGGERIPGSVWVKLDSRRVMSVGGLVHEFDANGRLAAIHWSSGAHPRLEYLAEEIAGASRTTEIRQCEAPGACVGHFQIGHDAQGHVVSIRDRAQRTADFAYDADGNLVVARDGLDTARGWPGTRYAYYTGGRLHAVTSSEGERIEFEIGWNVARVKAVRQIGGQNPVHRFVYGRSARNTGPSVPDRWTRYTDPFGNTSVYGYDGLGRLHRHELPTGEVSERAWTGYEISRLTLPDGVTTTWEHHDWDEIVRHEPSGNVVRIDFRIFGGENRENPYLRPIDAIWDGLGLLERRSYANGRLVAVENGAGERTSFAYDGENMLASVTAPSGVGVTFSGYGEHGHPTRVAFAGEIETRAYDAVGNLVSRSGFERFDSRPGGEVSRSWDEDRNPLEIVLADAPLEGPAGTSAIAIDHRSDGRPVRIERPGGGDHEFLYDALGRLVERRERVDGRWQATRFELDAIGRVTAVALPNGMRRETEYDESGRIRTLRALRDGVPEASAVLAYEDGRLRSIVDAKHPAAELRVYDAAGRLSSIAFPGGEALELAYDPRGRKTVETYRLPGGSVLRTLGFGYDLANRETRLSDDGALVLERLYAGGRLDEVHYGNALVRRYGYDPASGLLSAATTEHRAWGIVEVSRVDLEAPAGAAELRLATETTSGGAAAATTLEAYALGPMGAAGKRVLDFDDGVEVRAYAYDALSNLTHGGDGLHPVYNAERNRLLRIEEDPGGAARVAYAYDEAGYATARSGTPIHWTAQGFVAAIGADAEFDWDALGRPLRRVVQGEETRLLFGGRVEADSLGAPDRIDLDEVVLQLDTGERRYRHHDFRGNVKLVSDDRGDVVAHYGYSAYGIEQRTGSSDDASTFARGRAIGDLVLLGGRLHDPSAGRFLAPDPILQLASQHGYTQANPVWFWDPTGSAPMPAGMRRALVKMVTGLGLTSAGVWIGMHLHPATGLVLGGLGLATLKDGAFDLWEEVDEDRERRARLRDGGAGSSGAPGAAGLGPPEIPEMGGPDHPLEIPPNPGCPCGDGIPGGGHTGAGLSLRIGFGFGGFGGF
jgi:RHS repeat-associated protein